MPTTKRTDEGKTDDNRHPPASYYLDAVLERNRLSNNLSEQITGRHLVVNLPLSSPTKHVLIKFLMAVYGHVPA